jgi:centrosomal CEP192-like protein
MGTHAEDSRSWVFSRLRLGTLLLLAAPFLSAQNSFVFNGSRDQSGSPKAIILKNTASIARNIAGITLSGPQSGDFQQTNTCSATLAAGADCAITVTFSPQGTGTRTAVLQITDSASNTPQIINLSGIGAAPPSIGLGVPSGGSSSATVTAGQTASYALSLGGGGISGTATLTCSGAPTDAACIVPTNENISASAVTSFKVSVSTTSRTTTADLRAPSFTPSPWVWATLLMGWAVLPNRKIGISRGKQSVRHLPLLLLLILFLGSCGGGVPSSTSPPPPSPSSSGTPAGTYVLKVTATSGSVSQSMSLSLTVQ